MKKQVLFIHSAGPQGIDQGSCDLIADLKEQLGEVYHVSSPAMPDPDYALWKAQIANEIEALDEEVLLIGHSLGGSVLLKFLSEEGCRRTVSGLFLIAAPTGAKTISGRVKILDCLILSPPCCLAYQVCTCTTAATIPWCLSRTLSTTRSNSPKLSPENTRATITISARACPSL